MADDSDQLISLAWKSFRSSTSNAFTQQLWSDGHFSDVSLVTEDEEQIFRVHKIVLSAASPFFKSILLGHQHSDPIIYLEGVRQDDLRNLLEMIYTGKCVVKLDRLEAFLMVAKELKVSSVDDWKVDKHGVESETIEEEVEDGECVEFASDTSNSQEICKRRRTQATRTKIARTTRNSKPTESQNTRKIQSNIQANAQIFKRRHTGRG